MIRLLIELLGEHGKVAVEVQDQTGWLPLHHACRSSPSEETVRLLLEADGRHQSVWKLDNLNRGPLHIVCDGPDVNVGVLRLLLEADTRKCTIHTRSRFLGWLPLHFACANNASYAVIKELLEFDKSGKSVRTKSEDGLFPIHLALRRNVGADVIRALLEKDSKGSTIVKGNTEMGDALGNLLPIHIACAMGSSPEVIGLLLDNDHRGSTVGVEIDEGILGDDDHQLTSRVSKGMIPLHIACSAENPSYEVIKLLLDADDDAKSTLLKADGMYRLPLHHALSRRASAEVVKTLLSYQKCQQILHADSERSYPLHYACRYGTTGHTSTLA